jgi:hypothetical protein
MAWGLLNLVQDLTLYFPIFNFSAQKLKNKKCKCNISFTDGRRSLSLRILSLLPNSVEILYNNGHSGEKLHSV